MPALRIGPLRIGASAARRLGAGAAAAAVGGGLWLGVATAAPSGPVASIPAETPNPITTPGKPAQLPAAQPIRPLRDLLSARVRKQQPAKTRALVGRFVRADEGGMVVAMAPGQFREVKVTPQTRLPKRQPRTGQGVLVLGQPSPDGTFVAKAILLGKAPAAAGARSAAPSGPRPAAARQAAQPQP